MITFSYSLPLFGIAMGCGVVGMLMFLTGLIYWVRATYPPKGVE